MTQPWKRWTLGMLRRAGAFVVAALTMVLLGSAASSYFVQRAWSAAGAASGMAPQAIPFSDRIGWAAHDLVGMFVPYCPLIAIALLVAFLVAGALAHFTGFRM